MTNLFELTENTRCIVLVILSINKLAAGLKAADEKSYTMVRLSKRRIDQRLIYSEDIRTQEYC